MNTAVSVSIDYKNKLSKAMVQKTNPTTRNINKQNPNSHTYIYMNKSFISAALSV